MNRKQFLQSMLGVAGGLVAAPLAWSQEARGEDGSAPERGPFPRRRLGEEGPEVTVLGLGGSHLGACESEAEARRLMETALEEGVRFFDNAESYQSGKAERWMGAALEGLREEVFLMTKTHSPKDRSAESARRHLEGSLERLGTDYLDLWQLHSVKDAADVDRAFAKGGAWEFIARMKEEGVVRQVGVTGHVHPEANRRALHHFDEGLRFDAMQLPLNPMDYHQLSFQRALLPELKRRGIGIIAMKTTAAGALVQRGVSTIAENLDYVWSLPVSVIVSGMESPAQVRTNAALARAHEAMDAEQMEALLERLEPKKDLTLEWYKKR